MPRPEQDVAGELTTLNTEASVLEIKVLAEQLAPDESVFAALTGYIYRLGTGFITEYDTYDCLLAVTLTRALRIDTTRAGWFSSPSLLEVTNVYLSDVIEVSYVFQTDGVTRGYSILIKTPSRLLTISKRSITEEQARRFVDLVRQQVVELRDHDALDHLGSRAANASGVSLIEALERLAALRSGLTDEEFEVAKRRLLAE